MIAIARNASRFITIGKCLQVIGQRMLGRVIRVRTHIGAIVVIAMMVSVTTTAMTIDTKAMSTISVAVSHSAVGRCGLTKAELHAFWLV